MLTQERAQALADFLSEDADRAKGLFEMNPHEAVKEINAAGNDFTVDEVVEFGRQLKIVASKNGELNEDELNDVAGGLAVEGVAISCISLGFVIGQALAKNFGW